MGCATAIHLAASSLALARSEGRTAVALFVDLRAAFYSCIRSTALPLQGEGAAEDVQYIDSRADMPHALRPLLSFVLAQPAALAHLRTRPHLVAALVEAHRATHFSTTHSTAVARARRGKRPGSPLADAVFSLSFAAPLATVADYIRSRDLVLDTRPPQRLLSTEADADEPCTDVAYADDALFLAFLVHNERIVSQIRGLLDTVHVCMLSAGYQPNYKKGKSAVMVEVAGKGARDARLALAQDDFLHSDTWGFKVHLTHEYKYLGAMGNRRFDPYRQAGYMCCRHHGAFNPIKAALRKMDVLSVSELTLVTDVLCTVHLLYATETWSDTSERTLQRLEHTRARSYRLIQRATVTAVTHDDQRFTDSEVLARAGRAPLAMYIRKRRLRWLVSILADAPPQLRTLLDCLRGSPHDWCRQLSADFEWLQSYTVYPTKLDPTDPDPPGTHRAEWTAFDWVRWFRSDPHAARLLTQRAWVASSAAAIDFARREAFRRRFWAALRPRREEIHTVHSYVCYDCGATFPTVAGLRRHQTNAHRPLGLCQLYAVSSQCRLCLSDFRSRSRLVTHLRGRTGCLEQLAQQFDPLPVEEAQRLHTLDLQEQSSLKKQGYNATQAFAPATRRLRVPPRPPPREPPAPPPAIVTTTVVSAEDVPAPRFALREPKFILHLFFLGDDGWETCSIGSRRWRPTATSTCSQ